LNNNLRTSTLKHRVKAKFLDNLLPHIEQSNRVRFYIFYVPLIVGILFFITLLYVPPGEEGIPALVYFIGRFHPLIIHFPIVLILLVLVFEVLSRLSLVKISTTIISFLLLSASFFCAFAIIAGFLLYYTGEYAGDIMVWHKWAGIGVGIGIFLTTLFFLLTKNSNDNFTYLILLCVTNVLLLFASHQGGSLTHGKEYLTEYMPRWFAKETAVTMKPLEEMIIYQDIMVPMLDAKCMSCHNENKTKGELMMTTYEGLMTGGKSEMATVFPNDAENSGIYHRVTLPENDDEHMPPEGKTPLSNDEKFLLQWWINQGASPALTVQEAGVDSLTQAILESYLSELTALHVSRQNREEELEALMEMAGELEKKLNIVIQPDPETRGENVVVSMQFPPAVFGDNELSQLKPLFSRISKLSLVGSSITDDGLYHISKMSNLKQLILQQTPINGTGLIYLTQLQYLEHLNLSKTEVDDAGILHILKISSLKEVHLNQTKVSETLVQALQKNNPVLQVQLDRGKYF